MVITDWKFLYCYGVTEGNEDKKFSTLEYNNRTVYDFFSHPFTDDCVSLDIHLPPITIDDRPPLHKRSRYAPDLILTVISFASKNSVSTLTTPSHYPDLLPTYYSNNLDVLKKFVPFKGRVNRGYCCWK